MTETDKRQSKKPIGPYDSVDDGSYRGVSIDGRIMYRDPKNEKRDREAIRKAKQRLFGDDFDPFDTSGNY